MEDIVIFLERYGSSCLAALCLVLQIVYFFIKRRPQTIDSFLSAVDCALRNVPFWCSLVECPGHGEEKKSSVLNLCLKDVSKSLKRDLSDSESLSVIKLCSEFIELVLSAPRKGEKNESR